MKKVLSSAQQTGQRPLHVQVGGPHGPHDGTRELITMIEACGEKRVMLPPMVVFKGTVHYKGLYTEVTEEKHAYSPKGAYYLIIYSGLHKKQY